MVETRRWLHENWSSIALALCVGAIAAIMFASHRPGHWWGDDWALYVRQAEALLDTDTSDVRAQNQFTVDHSLGPPFSPPLYPWGFPILLAPFVAIVGTDLDALAVVPVVSAALFTCCWYALAAPRLGRAAALVGTFAVSLTPLLLGWSELIQSEWPFLAVVGVGLVVLDRISATGGWLDPSRSVWGPIGAGVVSAAAFSVRREGVALLAAIAAAQLAALVAELAAARSRGAPAGSRISPIRCAAPYAVAFALAAVSQVVLASTLVPRYEGAGIGNVWRLAGRHVRNLAQIAGFQQPNTPEPVALGSTTLGWIVVIVWLVAASVGVVVAVTRTRTRDLHLVAYACAAFVIGASSRSAINRYLGTVGPVLTLLALVGVRALAGGDRRPRVATAVVTVVLSAIAVGNVADAIGRIDRTRSFIAEGQVEWGPTHPEAVEMFDAVRRYTDPGDVVGAPKARAMVLETGLDAVQVDGLRPLPRTVDLDVVVAESSSPILIELRAAASGYREVWHNARFSLFERRPAP